MQFVLELQDFAAKLSIGSAVSTVELLHRRQQTGRPPIGKLFDVFVVLPLGGGEIRLVTLPQIGDRGQTRGRQFDVSRVAMDRNDLHRSGPATMPLNQRL